MASILVQQTPHGNTGIKIENTLEKAILENIIAYNGGGNPAVLNVAIMNWIGLNWQGVTYPDVSYDYQYAPNLKPGDTIVLFDWNRPQFIFWGKRLNSHIAWSTIPTAIL